MSRDQLLRFDDLPIRGIHEDQNPHKKILMPARDFGDGPKYSLAGRIDTDDDEDSDDIPTESDAIHEAYIATENGSSRGRELLTALLDAHWPNRKTK